MKTLGKIGLWKEGAYANANCQTQERFCNINFFLKKQFSLFTFKWTDSRIFEPNQISIYCGKPCNEFLFELFHIREIRALNLESCDVKGFPAGHWSLNFTEEYSKSTSSLQAFLYLASHARIKLAPPSPSPYPASNYFE